MALVSTTLLARVRDLILQETEAESDHSNTDIYEYLTNAETDALDMALAKDVNIERQELFGSLITKSALVQFTPSPNLYFEAYELPTDYRAPKVVYLNNVTQERSYSRKEFLNDEYKKAFSFSNQFYNTKGGCFFEGQYLLVKKPSEMGTPISIYLSYVKNPTALSSSQNPEIGDSFKDYLIYSAVSQCFMKTQELEDSKVWSDRKNNALLTIFGA